MSALGQKRTSQKERPPRGGLFEFPIVVLIIQLALLLSSSCGTETGGGTTGKRRGSTSCGHVIVIVVSGKLGGTCGLRDSASRRHVPEKQNGARTRSVALVAAA
jgi:hypothetical protein